MSREQWLDHMIKAIVFDFGGVLAEEGFRNGLMAIARQNDVNPEAFFEEAREIIYGTGYVTGRTDEHTYWETVRKETGIKGDDAEWRKKILSRFVLRTEMMQEVDSLRAAGYLVVLLSDQTNWLDELDEGANIYRHFDHAFNSFTMGKSKKEPDLFNVVAKKMGVRAEEIVFIDDNVENVRMARSQGWQAILFRDTGEVISTLERLLKNAG